MDDKIYPQGRKGLKTRYVAGILKFFTAAGSLIYSIDPILGKIIRTGQAFQVAMRAKVGTTAGWVIAAANDLPYMATLPASQTSSTLILPIDGLRIGDIITGFKI